MRVRKPTSKRTSTRMREGIKKKAAAQKRKETKLAKKNPQWKSRKPKEFGLPASFPYKEDIINEIEEKRRRAQEEKERRKAEKKQNAQRTGEVDDEDDEMEVEDDEDNSNGLAALVESAQQAAKEYEGGAADDVIIDDDNEEGLEYADLDLDQLIGADGADDEDDDEFYGVYKDNEDSDKSLKAYNKFFKAVVDSSDVVLYVLDARDPEGTRSKKVEEAILSSRDKKLILLLNKVDLVPNDVMNKWLEYYKNRFPIIPIKGSAGSSIAVANNFNKNLSQSVTASALLNSLKGYANKSDLKRSIVVGIVGFPNVGKSSIINALTSKHGGSSKVCPVGNQPGVTTALREVKVDNKLKIIDSPGIVFPPAVAADKAKGSNRKKLKLQQEAKLALLNAIPLKLVKDPTLAIQLLIKRLQRNPSSYETFQKYYDLPPLADNDIEEYTKQVLIHVARIRGRLGKGGVPHFHSAGMCILNDWKDGRFVGWTIPPEKPLQQKLSENTVKVHGKVDQTTIVQQWSEAFDLDGLFASTGIETTEN